MADSTVREKILAKLELLMENNLLNKSAQIFNCDEAGMQIDSQKGNKDCLFDIFFVFNKNYQ